MGMNRENVSERPVYIGRFFRVTDNAWCRLSNLRLAPRISMKRRNIMVSCKVEQKWLAMELVICSTWNNIFVQVLSLQEIGACLENR